MVLKGLTTHSSPLQGLFSRITFREPLYVGGSNNLTSLAPRLGVTDGLRGCVRRLQVNDHVYRFRRSDPLREPNLSADYAALDGWGISKWIETAVLVLLDCVVYCEMCVWWGKSVSAY
ncbi:hypothetical protein E2C01_065659 [Portunus trituberculatus]|uniref:Laminin G domain-containing protein n=1 Tax=Portunus trituberculatus TaxID=210409 RepID=A0A5B7HJF4_PORTR|nr:hypothetical protein [Portunus trituberculatus]